MKSVLSSSVIGYFIVLFCVQTRANDCPSLPGIKYGTIDLKVSVDKLETTAQYRCYYGYQLFGQASYLCRNRKWMSAINPPKCVQISCAALPYVAYGSWKTDQNQKVAVLTCDEGFELLTKSNSVVCTRKGESLYWNGETPKCIPVLQVPGCRLPPLIDGGLIVTSKKEIYDPGDHAEIECNVGYKAVGGSLQVVCDENGKWDDHFSQCQPITCSRPEMPRNGKIYELDGTDTKEFPFAYEITYNCTQGHELIGPKYRLCDLEGWSGQEPYCKVIICEGTPMLENGHVVSNRTEMKYYPSERANVVCDIGYKHSGKERHVICMHDGTWNNMAICSKIVCDFPELSPHLTLKKDNRVMNGNHTFQFTDLVVFSCDQGYLLQGLKERICEDNGWPGKTPICSEITCTTPHIPQNGYLAHEKPEYKYNESVTYKCNPRFALWSGSRERTCTELGWSGNLPKCKVLGCEKLAIPNGKLTVRPNRYGYYNLGTSTTVLCDPEYRLSTGALYIYCNYFGKWLGKIPSCEEITCPVVHHEMLLVTTNQTFYVPGDSLSITCPENFNPVDGSTTITCLLSGKWSDSFATCQAKSCPDPPHIENGEVIKLFDSNDATYAPERKVAVMCDQGYTLIGEHKRNVCLKNGTWIHLFPSCSVTSCGRPEIPENGKLVFTEMTNETKFTYNSLAKFECNGGYRLVGEKEIRCGESGWLGQSPRCLELFCPSTINEYAGYIWLKTRAKYGYTAEIRCHSRFILHGNATSVCLENGSWSKRPFEACEAITCSVPEIPAFGIISILKKKYNLDELVRFHCQKGFSLIGKPQVRCLHKGWSDKPPTCKPNELRKCPRPPTISHAQLSSAEKDNYVTGDRINFICNPGYVSSSLNTYLLCGTEGSWDVAAECQEKKNLICSDIPSLTHGHIVMGVEKKEFAPGDVIAVNCDSGYRSVDEDGAYVTCLPDGQWNLTSAQCQVVVCKAPHLSANLSYIEEHINESLPFEFEINFRCEPGFVLMGARWIICTENGWSDETPFCKPIKCYEPGIPEGGQRLGMSFNIGDKVQFSCFSGFTLIGDAERICLPSGQWSGHLTRCNAPKNYCINPGTPVNGVKIGTKYMLGDVVEFRCKPGFTLVGSRSRICLPNRQWRGREPRCLGRQEFDNYETVNEGIKKAMDTIKIRQSKELAALKENNLEIQTPRRIVVFFVLDSSKSIGRRNFEITVEFVKAVVKYLEVTEEGTRVGVITYSKAAQVAFSPEQYNNTNDVLNALDSIQYSEGGTKLEAALKLLYDQVLPSTRKKFNLFFPLKSRKLEAHLKSVVFVISDGKLALADNPQPIVRKLKAQVKFICLGMTGHSRKEVFYSLATSRADRVYLLDCYSRLEQLTTDLLNKDDYRKCGIPSHDSEDRSWPWSAYVTSIDTNTVICRGTIVASSWIMTSASCMKNHITNSTSLLGIYFDGSDQIGHVASVSIHPLFETKYLDFDIALLRLGTALEFSATLHHICLPPRDFDEKQLYGDDTNGYVTFGTMSENQSFFVEQSLALPIKSMETCDAYLKLRGSVMPGNMFCAGDGSVHLELCSANQRGSPMLQFTINGKDQLYWVQIGIQSAFNQCATNSFYMYYTHVAKLRQWLDDTMGFVK